MTTTYEVIGFEGGSDDMIAALPINYGAAAVLETNPDGKYIVNAPLGWKLKYDRAMEEIRENNSVTLFPESVPVEAMGEYYAVLVKTKLWERKPYTMPDILWKAFGLVAVKTFTGTPNTALVFTNYEKVRDWLSKIVIGPWELTPYTP